MVFILVVVIGLVAWALHLMQEAIDQKEFSLMLAGFLVSSAAAALVAVYLLMGHYMSYMTDMTHRSQVYRQGYEFSYYMETVLPSLADY
ncbi:MAG: hypothetical protein ACFB8W_20845 [Elainellaceae cyanobacterium]